MDNEPDKKCKQCGKNLIGRLDKLFCDSQCRNTFNNQNKRSDQLLIQDVNQRIRRNRRILKSLCPIGKATVRKEVLDTMQYDYRYFSSIFKSPNNNVYYICYDYAFSPIKQKESGSSNIVEKALIVQRQDYMDQLSFQIWKKST